MFKQWIALLVTATVLLAQSQPYPAQYPRTMAPQYPAVAPLPRTASAIPAALLQCEADQCTKGGGGAVWLFDGRRGQAMWHFSAVANLTVESFDGRTIVIHREDPNPSYSSPRFADTRKRPDGVFFADYVGVLHGNRIDGQVTWNGGGTGTWYATIPEHLCNPIQQCPLDVGQMLQMGRNALHAKLFYAALRCFWVAAQQGNGDGQSLAGTMIRDGVGTKVNPALALSLLQASAQQDNYNGELALSQTYELGIGIPPDPQQAEYWKTRAYQKMQQLRARQAQQQRQQQQQGAEIVAGVVLLGLLGAMLIGGDSSSDDVDRSPTNQPTPYNYSRDRELSRRSDWYWNGGSFGGPPPGWEPGQPTDKPQ